MFMNFVAMVDRQFSQTIKVVQSDNDTKFNCLISFLPLAFFKLVVLLLHNKMGGSNKNTNIFLMLAVLYGFKLVLLFIFWGKYTCSPLTFFLVSLLLMMPFVHLVVFALPIIIKLKGINLLVEVGSVCLWVTLLVRKVDGCLILTPRSFSFPVMLNFLRMCTLSSLPMMSILILLVWFLVPFPFIRILMMIICPLLLPQIRPPQTFPISPILFLSLLKLIPLSPLQSLFLSP